jgi:hypothetical protein
MAILRYDLVDLRLFINIAEAGNRSCHVVFLSMVLE